MPIISFGRKAFGRKGPVRQSVETSLASLERRAMTDSTEGKDERRFATEGRVG